MEKSGFNSRALIPIATAIVSLVYIGIGLKQFGFWNGQPTAAFFPIIIAVVLLLTSLLCLFQIVKGKEAAPKYNKDELLVILGAGGIIVGCWLIGLIASCLVYLFIWLKFVEHSSWKVILIIEAIVAALIIGVFVVWMQVQFPVGLLAYVM